MIKESYLLLGPELGEKKSYIDSIKSEIKKANKGEIEEKSYYPYDTDMTEAITTAESISMFSDFKIITINDCCALNKKETDLFIEYLKKPSPDTVIIFTDSAIKAAADLEKAVKEKKIFWELSESQRKNYVLNYFYKKNIPIDAAAAAMIAENSDSNTLAVKNECDKLIFFFGNKKKITGEAIENFLFYNREENVFTLFGYIMTGELDKTLGVAENILLTGESAPIQLLGGLIRQFRNFLDFKILLKEKYSPSDAFAKKNIRSRKIQNIYSGGNDRYTLKETEKILSLCAYYDELFRTIKTDMQNMLFSIFIYEVMIKKGERTENTIFSEDF